MNKAINKKILHITPHLGGGVGRVVLNYLIRTKNIIPFKHDIACFDYANQNALFLTKSNNIKLMDNIRCNPERLLDEIKKADIILIHWWNHPLLYNFIIRYPLPDSRVIIWSHVSGFHPPHVLTKKILSYPDLFVFTSPISFDTKEVNAFPYKNKLMTVWSTGGFDHVKAIDQKKHYGFNVGYIGTVDYSKMHPDFIKICNTINIPNVKFIVCGGSNHENIKQQAREIGILNKFHFTGKVTDITKYLSQFDVFGYPLAFDHYGTCDQVLAESMAAGIVPVVLSNKMEKYMIKNKVTGLVAENSEEYVRAIEYLYYNPDFRKKLSENCKIYAHKTYSLNSMISEWDKIYTKLLNYPKTKKNWDSNNANIEASDIFIESLGPYGECFRFYKDSKTTAEKQLSKKKIQNLAKSARWKSRTKGTVHHYLYFFKDDPTLLCWSKLMS